ncbi:MAG: hypothetical protein K2M17_05995 [Bacilli bacterium]|nr:hypothetical protein [Bacilli bacterium]
MKKTILIAGLMAAVAITSFSVSGTYAKYTSETTATDQARVAKWNIDKSIEIKLFDTSYGSKKEINGGKVKVVAPGAKGKYTFTLDTNASTDKYTEVAYTVNIEMDETDAGTNIKGQKSDGSNYYPIKYYVDVQDDDHLCENVETLAAKLNEVISDGKNHTIFWEWPFNVDDESNKADTELGTTADQEVVLKVKVTATQVAPTYPEE